MSNARNLSKLLKQGGSVQGPLLQPTRPRLHFGLGSNWYVSVKDVNYALATGNGANVSAQINVGNAWNPSSGVFTAPEDGSYFIYHRQLVYMTNIQASMLVNIAKNNSMVALGYAHRYGNYDGVYNDVSVETTLQLVQGDQIYWDIQVSGTITDFASNFIHSGYAQMGCFKID